MSIEKGIYQYVNTNLSSPAAVTGVYWILAPKNKQQTTSFPFIVLQRVMTSDTQTMAGDANFRNALFQVDAYGSTYYQARAAADAVRDLLKSYTGTLPDTDATVVAGVLQTKDWDLPYEEGGASFVYRVMCEFRVWYYET